MKQAVIIFFVLFLGGKCPAQSVAGITGTRDTSYNLAHEFQRHLKNHPGIKMVEPPPPGSIKEKKDIEYCSTPQRNLKLDVFCPAKKTKGKRTAVIIIHGGGWRSGNKSMLHPMAQHLAALGYVCFTPEYRLSTDRSFEGNDCVFRRSAVINAVIDLDGTLAFIHPESGEGDDSKRVSAGTNWFGYSKTENPGLWKQAAPLTHAGKHTPPTLFINSNVARMHAGRDDYIKVLDQYKIYTEVRSFDAPHAFCLFEPWFTPTVKYMDDFLKKIFKQ
jgi:pectinesterase